MKILLFGLLTFLNADRLLAQPYLYFADFGPTGELDFNYINLATCEVCEHFSVPYPGIPEAEAILPDGNVLIITNGGLIQIYNPSNGNTVNTFNVGGTVSTAVPAPNGNLYYFKISFAGSNYETCLYEFDPLTGNDVLIGCEDNYILFNAFYWNGTIAVHPVGGAITQVGGGALGVGHTFASRHKPDVAGRHHFDGAGAIPVFDLPFEQEGQLGQPDVRMLVHVEILAGPGGGWAPVVNEGERPDLPFLAQRQQPAHDELTEVTLALFNEHFVVGHNLGVV